MQCDGGACATAKRVHRELFQFVFYSNVKIKEAILFFLFKLFLLILECTQAKDALVNNVKF